MRIGILVTPSAESGICRLARDVGSWLSRDEDVVLLDTYDEVAMGACDVFIQYRDLVGQKYHKGYNRLKRFTEALAKKQGKRRIIIDRTCIPFIKGAWYSLSFDAIKRRGDYCTKDVGRWNDLKIPEFTITKKLGNGPIIVFGQLGHYASFQFDNYQTWLQTTLRQVRKATKRPIIFRAHPKVLYYQTRLEANFCRRYGIKYSAKHHVKLHGRHSKQHSYSIENISKYLKNAFCCVTHNSGAGVVALMQGVPVVTTSKSFMGWDISEHKIENIDNPYIPNERSLADWKNWISQCIWSADDLRNNTWWPRFKEKLC